MSEQELIRLCLLATSIGPLSINRKSHSDRNCTYACYSQSFVYCHVFVLLKIDYSLKKGVLVHSRKCASEIVYFRSNPYESSAS